MTMRKHAAVIEREMGWFQEILATRLGGHAGNTVAYDLLAENPPPAWVNHQGDDASDLPPYAEVVRELELDAAERLILMLAFVPHFRPQVLDALLLPDPDTERRFTEFGGRNHASHAGFLPTGETAMFVLAGQDGAARLRYRQLFEPEHRLFTSGMLRLDQQDGAPRLAAPLILSRDFERRLTTGAGHEPPLSSSFQAQQLDTQLSWTDLLLPPPTRQAVDDIARWLEHEDELMDRWRLGQRVAPGFRALFHGPPGTGKTLAASLLGKASGRTAYRIDLASIISKFIGETEKNLDQVLNAAAPQRSVLLFDEADALFGKRSEVENSHDRFADQQTSLVLRRIEEYPGLVILASNLKRPVDSVLRRLQASVYFPLPDADLRLRLWRDLFADLPATLADDVDLEALANDHQLSGGSIVNVLRTAAVRAVSREPQEIRAADLEWGIGQELSKQGRV